MQLSSNVPHLFIVNLGEFAIIPESISFGLNSGDTICGTFQKEPPPLHFSLPEASRSILRNSGGI